MDVLDQIAEAEKKIRDEKRERIDTGAAVWCSLCQSNLPTCWDKRKDKWDIVDFFDFGMPQYGIGVMPVHKACKDKAIYDTWKEENDLE